MSRWDIRPEGVQGTVGRTAEVAGKLQGQARSYHDHVQSVAQSAGTLAGPCDPASMGMSPVGAAVVAYANNATQALNAIADRTEKPLNGTVAAVGWYLNGDLEMAENAEKDAIAGREAKTPWDKK